MGHAWFQTTFLKLYVCRAKCYPAVLSSARQRLVLRHLAMNWPTSISWTFSRIDWTRLVGHLGRPPSPKARSSESNNATGALSQKTAAANVQTYKLGSTNTHLNPPKLLTPVAFELTCQLNEPSRGIHCTEHSSSYHSYPKHEMFQVKINQKGLWVSSLNLPPS